MSIQLDVNVHWDSVLSAIADLKKQVLQQGATTMSAVTDFAAKVEANFAATKAGIQALDDKITALQNSPGTLSASDQAALDAIVADSAALVTQTNALPPTVVPVP
jgi:hypothetical protein